MPSIKDLKKRIGSTKNTQQTTRAMKMVSAAKLRRSQDAIMSQRPYARRVGDLIRLVAGMTKKSESNPLIVGRELAEGEKKKLLLVLVTSDRGLCGGFNSNIIKTAQRWLRDNESNFGEVKLGFVGRKGFDFFKTRRTNNGPYFSEVGGKVTFQKAQKLASQVMELYNSGTVDEVQFVYNEFKNAISQKVIVETYLPLSGMRGGADSQAQADGPIYFVKPSAEVVLEQLLAKNFAMQAFRILLESQAGEHGARMSAMENATKNAGEMIRKLTLQYNKQRQANITKELLEIISGSESQKGA